MDDIWQKINKNIPDEIKFKIEEEINRFTQKFQLSVDEIYIKITDDKPYVFLSAEKKIRIELPQLTTVKYYIHIRNYDPVLPPEQCFDSPTELELIIAQELQKRFGGEIKLRCFRTKPILFLITPPDSIEIENEYELE